MRMTKRMTLRMSVEAGVRFHSVGQEVKAYAGRSSSSRLSMHSSAV